MKAAAPLEIELTRLTKIGGPLTKRISLAPDGTLVKDGSACVMAHGTAERVRVTGVDAFGALIEDLAPVAGDRARALRAGLPDKVEVTTEKLLNGVMRPDLIARTGPISSIADRRLRCWTTTARAWRPLLRPA